jgi:hypothetical protein
MANNVLRFTVEHRESGSWTVCESGAEASLADFETRDEATHYALGIAASKPRWQVDVLDASGEVLETYNSEDDAMAQKVI